MKKQSRTVLRTALIVAGSGVLVWAGGAAPALAAYSPPSVVICKSDPVSNTGVAVGQYSNPVPAGLCTPVGGFSNPVVLPPLPGQP
jgi:hypothetical protein